MYTLVKCLLCFNIYYGTLRGTVIAVPAPEHLAIPNDVYESAVSQAEMEASYEDVRDKNIFIAHRLLLAEPRQPM